MLALTSASGGRYTPIAMLRQLRLLISTSVVVEDPRTAPGAFITRWAVKIRAAEQADDGSSEVEAEVGHAQLAHLHVGTVHESGESLDEVLAAEGGVLATLRDVYFRYDDFILDFWSASGVGLLYIEELAIHPSWQGRNIELAVVQRLAETLADGCKLIVLHCASHDDATPWVAMGFERSTADGAAGFHHLVVDSPPSRVVPELGNDFGFEVLPREDYEEALLEEAAQGAAATAPSPLEEAAQGAAATAPSPSAERAEPSPPPRAAARRRRGAPRRR
jgi:ribosomal protein S18 acetylase RimI-like enzyme